MLDFESGGGHGLNSEICARLFQNLRKTQTLLFAKNIMTLLGFLQHGISAMILPAVRIMCQTSGGGQVLDSEPRGGQKLTFE